MSARRWFAGAVVAAGLAAGAASAARAQSVVARVGGELAGRPGGYVEVPVTVDMTGAPGVRLGSYRADLRYNPAVLAYAEVRPGTFAAALVNSDSASSGRLRFTAIQPSGADGEITLLVAKFYVLTDTVASSAVELSFDEMSAAGTFEDLLPILSVVNGSFCRSYGTWGDVDLDGRSNSRDALIALSKVVGLALDTARIDTISVDPLVVDTTVSMRPGFADVDGDGFVTSRDALIIISHAVGLPVPGFRIGMPAAAGGCAPGLGITITAAPDTLELQTGQEASFAVSAHDGAGLPVSLSGATWASGNTGVAGALANFGVVARDPGVSVFTVRLGAGAGASVVVKVIEHRTQWFVDALAARGSDIGVPLQTGSPAFPFAYIQDALYLARDGDTVNVAPGVYEEAPSADVSVLLRGDEVDVPTIDPRAADGYYAHGTALNVGSRAAPMTIENLRVLDGQVAVYSYGFAARNLSLESGDSLGTALYLTSAASAATGDTGNVVLDNVTVHGYGTYGIRVEVADTVIVRNSSVTRDSARTYSCSVYLEAEAGILVYRASHTEISGTQVSKAPCVGIGVQQAVGTATLSGNTVVRAPGAGLVVKAPHVALDHNYVREVLSADPDWLSVGIWVPGDTTVLSVTSLGDVVRNVGAFGFRVDAVRAVTLDSLVADSTAQDGTYEAAAALFYDSRVTLTNSHFSNIPTGPGVFVYGETAVLESRHNSFERIAGEGIIANQWGPFAYAPPIMERAAGAPSPSGPSRGGPALAGGFDAGGPDSVISVGDSFYLTGSTAVNVENGVLALIDSLVADSAGYGHSVQVQNYTSVALLNSRIRWAGSSGVYVYYVDTVDIVRSAILHSAAEAVFLYGVQGAAKVLGSVLDSSGHTGLYFYDNVGPVTLVVDSSRFAGNGESGIWTYCTGCTGSGTITRSTIAGNAVGIRSEGFMGGVNLVARRNVIAGNSVGGAMDSAYYSSSVTIDADSNYWGDGTYGSRCYGEWLGCNWDGVGDYILTDGISFADWLADPPADVMPAPPAFRPAARPAMLTSAASSADQVRRTAAEVAARSRVRQAPARPVSARAPEVRPAAPAARPPLISYRRGGDPRPAPVRQPQ